MIFEALSPRCHECRLSFPKKASRNGDQCIDIFTIFEKLLSDAINLPGKPIPPST
jgi:hypothetical protein